jgi:hypothetical protein
VTWGPSGAEHWVCPLASTGVAVYVCNLAAAGVHLGPAGTTVHVYFAPRPSVAGLWNMSGAAFAADDFVTEPVPMNGELSHSGLWPRLRSLPF